MEVLILTLTSALDERGQLHVPEVLPPEKATPYPSARSVGPRVGLDAVEKRKIFTPAGN
jgi:hypothetical protein